jgi:branched-chain amino acid transport system substrate-binding protein
MIRRSVVIAIIIGFALFPSSAALRASAAPSAPSEIVIGAALPLTGEESRVGTYFKAAYELAIKEVNDSGGIFLKDYNKKVPVRLIVYDDKTDPATSRDLYERLAVQDHVDAFLGGYSTDLIMAHTVVAQQHQIPYVNGGGAATKIYDRGFTTIFGLLASIQALSLTECEFITKMQAEGKLPKPLKMAVVYENTPHGVDFNDGLNQCVKNQPQNFQIVMSEAFDLHGKDFAPLLTKVKATNPDAFMADAHLDDYITMQRQFGQSGIHVKYITYGARGPEKSAHDALGDGVNYIVAASWWSNQLPGPAVKAFVAKWAAAYPSMSPEWFAALPYETVQVLVDGITAAGSLDKAKVTEALRKTDLHGTLMPTGTVKFQANGQVNNPFVVTQNLTGGNVIVVWPLSEATGKPTLPVP